MPDTPHSIVTNKTSSIVAAEEEQAGLSDEMGLKTQNAWKEHSTRKGQQPAAALGRAADFTEGMAALKTAHQHASSSSVAAAAAAATSGMQQAAHASYRQTDFSDEVGVNICVYTPASEAPHFDELSVERRTGMHFLLLL